MTNMQCPVCREALRSSDRHGIQIDVCPRCRGVWLDRGELDKLLEREADVRATLEESAREVAAVYDRHGFVGLVGLDDLREAETVLAFPGACARTGRSRMADGALGGAGC